VPYPPRPTHTADEAFASRRPHVTLGSLHVPVTRVYEIGATPGLVTT
jgi:hypothetical protein